MEEIAQAREREIQAMVLHWARQASTNNLASNQHSKNQKPEKNVGQISIWIESLTVSEQNGNDK